MNLCTTVFAIEITASKFNDEQEYDIEKLAEKKQFRVNYYLLDNAGVIDSGIQHGSSIQ